LDLWGEERREGGKRGRAKDGEVHGMTGGTCLKEREREEREREKGRGTHALGLIPHSAAVG
jgi:hypothetical protein